VTNRIGVFRVIILVSALAGCAYAQNQSPGGSTATRIGIIDIQRAVTSTTEGKRDLEALNKKYEPRQAALQKQASEIQELRKQLSAADKMTDDARAALLKKLEQKRIDLRHDGESVRADYQIDQREIVSRILKKMAPVVDKYAKDNGYAMIFDAQFWPQGPVLWANAAATDVTGAVVSAYNAQATAAVPATNSPATTAQTAPSR
jgi:Skp family chaperone for outer membrane proteins